MISTLNFLDSERCTFASALVMGGSVSNRHDYDSGPFLSLILELCYLILTIFLFVITTSFSQQNGGVELPHFEGGFYIT